jgi:hypothetical protein
MKSFAIRAVKWMIDEGSGGYTPCAALFKPRKTEKKN